MVTGAILQARMSSQRLPGKVLRNIHGKPMLQYLLERLEHCLFLDEIVIATSVHKNDDPVSVFCDEHNIACYRGSLEDVAGRFLGVLEEYEWQVFVRVNGDSPLLDPHLIDQGIMLYNKGRFDIVTNVFPRTFPLGQSVEVVNGDTFRRYYSRLEAGADHEHVTAFIYRNPDEYKIRNFTSQNDYSTIHLSVDTPHDLEVVSRIIGSMDRPHWEYALKDILDIYNRIAGNREG